MGGARAGKPGAGRMGRYRELTFHRAGDVPAASGDVVFREARLGKLLFFLVFGGLALGILAFPTVFAGRFGKGGDPAFVVYLIGGGMTIFAVFAYHALRSSPRTGSCALPTMACTSSAARP